MLLNFGFSPCPNDTFMFEAIYNKRIDLKGLKFNFVLEDIEQLNQMAFQSKLEVTKISFNAFSKLTDQYQLLTSGSALGKNCGPLLISGKENQHKKIEKSLIAIPGINTTANLLLSIAYPEANNKKEFLFSEIEDAVLTQKVDMGLIIHENRFTYQDKGLHKIIDLGEYWEEKTATPIPLGGIVIQRDLPEEIKKKVNQVLYDSIQFAFDHPEDGIDFIRENAQEMDREVMYKHIDLYVNNFSLDLGAEGKASIFHLFDMLKSGNLLERYNKSLFV